MKLKLQTWRWILRRPSIPEKQNCGRKIKYFPIFPKKKCKRLIFENILFSNIFQTPDQPQTGKCVKKMFRPERNVWKGGPKGQGHYHSDYRWWWQLMNQLPRSSKHMFQVIPNAFLGSLWCWWWGWEPSETHINPSKSQCNHGKPCRIMMKTRKSTNKM